MSLKTFYLTILYFTIFHYNKTDYIQFTDLNFKKALLKKHNIDTNKDGEIQIKEAENFKGKIDVSNVKSKIFQV